jgi:hypothetical protein
MKDMCVFKDQTLLEVAHEMAQGLRDASIISEKVMQEFDDVCLSPLSGPSSKAKLTHSLLASSRSHSSKSKPAK